MLRTKCTYLDSVKEASYLACFDNATLKKEMGTPAEAQDLPGRPPVKIEK